MKIEEKFLYYAKLKEQKNEIEAQIKELLPSLLKTGLKKVSVSNTTFSLSANVKYKLGISEEKLKEKYPNEYNESLAVHLPTLRKLVHDDKVYKKIISPYYLVKSK